MNEESDIAARPAVFIVDGDAAVRDGLHSLLSGAGLQAEVRTYASAEQFMASVSRARGCLIAEVFLPGVSGVELLEWLRGQGNSIPAILLASDSDVPLAVRAMRAGAADFLDKPFIDRILLSRVRQALELSGIC